MIAHEYLQAMGIDVWQRRYSDMTAPAEDLGLAPTQELSEVTGQAVCPSYCFALENTAGQPVALLIADASADSLNKAEQSLVEAIAAATKKTVTGGYRSDVILAQLIKPKQVIVLLGDQVARTVIPPGFSVDSYRGKWLDYEGCAVIVTHGLAAMLKDKSIKAAVWHDLKQAIQKMS